VASSNQRVDRPGAPRSFRGHQAQPPETAPEKGTTRERILDVALELFIDLGYEKTSLRQIAEKMGFTKAAIYYHFASKDDILMALHMRMHDVLRGALVAAAAGPMTPGRWREMVGELVDQILEHRAIFVLHERNRAALDELHRQPHDEDHEDLDEMFRRVLDDESIAARDRVRMACAVGAVMGPLLLSGNAFGDMATAELAALVRGATDDILTPADPGRGAARARAGTEASTRRARAGRPAHD
jgi:AcrR family transcriptional regulator